MSATRGEWWNAADPQIPIDVALPQEGEAESVARMPALAWPFAAFGGAAGLFAILALGSFRPAAREVSLLTPAILTAIVGGIAGIVLRRWSRLYEPMLARDALYVRVGMITALAGAAAGGLIGLFTWGPDGFIKFAGGGILVGLCFLPSCLVVFEAARRAGRGRHGSLVAATDRRTVHSTVLGGLAFASATQIPSLLNLEASNDLTPLAQALLSIVVAGGSVIGIAVLQWRDKKANVALEQLKKDAAWLDRVLPETEEEENRAAAAQTDLGLGSDQWTKTTDNTYRSSGRADVLVKGSIADAAKAFEECIQRRHRSLMVAAASLTAVSVSVALRLSVYFQ